MKDVIYNFINEHMMIHIVLIALCIAATIGAMFVDLVSGIMKAKQRGEARTSTGYKKTAIKAKKYFTPFIELCFIDLLCCVIIPFPVFSMIWRIGICISFPWTEIEKVPGKSHGTSLSTTKKINWTEKAFAFCEGFIAKPQKWFVINITVETLLVNSKKGNKLGWKI